MMLSLESHMAQREVNTILERTHKGRLAKAAQGQFMGSRAPYGRKIVKETEETENGRIIVKDRRLEIVPDEAHIIRLMFELYGYKDYSYDGVARYLGDGGYVFRNGERWSSPLAARRESRSSRELLLRALELVARGRSPFITSRALLSAWRPLSDA